MQMAHRPKVDAHFAPLVHPWTSPGRRAPLAAAIALALAGAPLPAVHAAVGDAVGDPITVVTQSSIYQADVAMGAEGNFTVVWYSSSGVYATCFDANGNPIGSQQTLSSAGYAVRVAADADGNSVAVWTMDDGSYDLGVQRLDSSCTPQGDPITITTKISLTTYPGVAMGPQGDFVIFWNDTAVNELRLQRYDAAGTPQGGVVTVASSTSSTGQTFAAARADGGFVVGWVENGHGKLRYYDADGSPLTDIITNNSLNITLAWYQSVAMDGDGDVVLPRYDYDGSTGEYDIYVQRYDEVGNAEGSPLRASVDHGPAGFYDVGAAVDDDGDFMVVWEGTSPSGIYARRYDAADTPGDEITVSSGGDSPDVAMDADGDAVVVWSSGGAIKAQRYEGKGQTVDLGVVAGSDAGGLIGGGEAITYTYTVTNNGSGSALDITLESVSPDELTYASLSADTDWDCAESGGTVTCTLPRMVSGGSASVEVSYTNATVSDGNLVNTVAVSTPMSDTDSSNDSDSVILPTTLNAAPGFDSTPAISGTAAVGGTVSVDTPVTEPDGDAYGVAYQWYADGAAISGATSDSYSVTTDEAHTTLTVTLTATDSNGYSASATASGVAVANAAPSFDATPSIDGTGLVGNTLTAVDTATSDTDADTVSLSYQWQADGVDIAGATAESYTLTSAEAHSDITVVVTADDGYDPVAVTTAAVTVDNTDPVISGVDITGSANPGETLTAVVSGKDDDGDTLNYSYAWYVDGVLAGTGESYIIGSGDIGNSLFVIVTVSDGHGGSDSGSSMALSITGNHPVFDATPTISGTAVVGSSLGVSGVSASDADGDAITYSYQWRSNGAAIAGATASSYTLSSAEAHSTITLQVTADDSGGGSATIISNGVTVQNSSPVFASTPSLSGTPSAGETIAISGLMVNDADGDTISYSYLWFADGTLVGTDSSYTIGSDDAGKSLLVAIYASDGYGGLAATVASGMTVDGDSADSSSTDGSASSSSGSGGGGAIGWLSMLPGLLLLRRRFMVREQR
jgi:uncharacterized repeat protein (TIGR01451 family)